MTEDIPERIREKYGDDIKMGGREDVLIDADATEREWIEYDGKIYWFDLKEISWERKTEILDDALEADQRTGDVDLNLKGYYRDMMEEVIADASIDGSIPIFLKGMNPEFGDRLQDLMPDPGTVMDEDEEGNSEEQ